MCFCTGRYHSPKHMALLLVILKAIIDFFVFQSYRQRVWDFFVDGVKVEVKLPNFPGITLNLTLTLPVLMVCILIGVTMGYVYLSSPQQESKGK